MLWGNEDYNDNKASVEENETESERIQSVLVPH